MKKNPKHPSKTTQGLFGIVVTVVIQNVFRLEIHQNDVFFLKKKIIFEINISKRFKNIKKYFLTKKN
jgi:RNase P/RNase MRP subunit p29